MRLHTPEILYAQLEELLDVLNILLDILVIKLLVTQYVYLLEQLTPHHTQSVLLLYLFVFRLLQQVLQMRRVT